uniref:Uncharacterized protein n=1 Tax=Lactuca sativa TaxID=4236 RepID=A0A9R1UV38_LACSA|nr:hypothetical protein LSAT_V11C800444500 [Lactuca sativa]
MIDSSGIRRFVAATSIGSLICRLTSLCDLCKLMGIIPHFLRELNAVVKGTEKWYNCTSDSNENAIQAMKGVDLEYTTILDIVYNMDLSRNKLVGEIPVELTALSMLVGLNLSNNHLSGRIPDTIGNMITLFSLDLSGNELMGTIPPSMATLTFLSNLNLSHNKLSGRIPTGNQLQTLTDPSIFVGNEGLCGPPISKNCSNQEVPTTTTTTTTTPTTTTTSRKKKYKAADRGPSRFLGCYWCFGVQEALETTFFFLRKPWTRYMFQSWKELPR